MQTEKLGDANGRGWPRMAADDEGREINALTGIIIGAGQKVSRVLGVGFLERIYENSLALELRRQGITVEQQSSIRVLYGGEVVGLYSADLLVESKVIVELKAQHALDEIHRLQCIHFGRPRMEFRRIVDRF